MAGRGATDRFPERLVELLRERDEERRRTARVLHDDIGPTLAAAGLHLDALRLDLACKVPDIGARTQEIQAVLELAMERLRQLSRDLNPSLVERAGLPFALDRSAEMARQRFSGLLRLTVNCTAAIPPQSAVAMHQAAEYALDNAVRHAGATRITLALTGKRKARIEIRDNGKGFDPVAERTAPKGVGLFLIHSLAARHGFQVRIGPATSLPENPGTIVRLIWE
ncbi:MAG: ATP-binding protein [Bryobacteraceae bacterium]|nr:ATP-binding protein [Bryobacteraceae bacterium]